jgi:glycosyltransferase involved in cell wall biosynthesis
VWTDHADLKHVWQNLSVWYKNPIGKMVYKAAADTHTITLVSKSELELVSRHLPEGSPIRRKLKVVYNGVVDSAASHPSKKSELFTYLVASRLVKDKGIQEVINAFIELQKEHPDTQLQIIGDGPDNELFKQTATSSTAIHLLGHQGQPLDFMANADAFVHPTYHEGFSVALVEAGMMSLPIIATAVGGNVEIIKNEETGLLVQPRSSDELLGAMKELYENKALREKLAKNTREQYISKFQFNIIVKESFIPLYGDTK